MERAALCGLLAAVVLSLAYVPPALSDQGTSIRALVQNPDQYDGKVVSVAGTVGAYRESVSDAGNPFTTFRLSDGDASVAVFIWNKQGLSNGQKVRVTGTFAKVKHVGTYTIDNEIQANRIEVQR